MLHYFDCAVRRTDLWTIRVIAENEAEAREMAQAAFSDGETPDHVSALVATAKHVEVPA